MFEISYPYFDKMLTKELIPNGANIKVDNTNIKEYVTAYVKWMLEDSVANQFAPFAEGFNTVCGSPLLFQIFRPEELEIAICGIEDYDFKELERATMYKGYTAENPVIKNFWSVVHDLNLEAKKKLLLFITGSDRVPIKGLKYLNLIILRSGPDSDHLPASHTCFNTLDLPEYSTREKLTEKLLLALQFIEGFGLR